MIEGDDKKQHKMWFSLLRDSAWYFDNPSIAQEKKMKDDLQLKYDDLLPEGWRPRLQSRNDLVAWACRQVK